MLQIIKIFVIVVICSIFTINIAKAQDKKLFDNVGVYFYPMVDVHMKTNIPKFYFDGWILGLRTNVILNDKFSLDLGMGFGQGRYNNVIERDRRFFPLHYYVDNLKSNIIRTDCHLRFKILNIEDAGYLYLTGGAVFNKNIYAKYDYEFEYKEFKFFNILFAMGTGYAYNINSSLVVNIEANIGIPIKRYHSQTRYSSGGLYYMQYNVNSGIYLGLIYKW